MLGSTHSGTPEGHAHPAESVETLGDSGADLDRVRSLVGYGTALRRAGRRTEAMAPLRQGLDLATRCGVEPLAAQAT
ncbi:hypothetical protein [Actinokineospora globicatena]|uniref:hypothetical protein n=1 Tax=Actinokineospora globicatena TaxID=103729 RepID=UPI0025560F3D|nr:hypothetical protein [Actinokineospora globicatena]